MVRARDTETNEEATSQLVWKNIIKFLVLHLMFVFGLSLVPSLSWPTLVWLLTTYLYSGAGITAGNTSPLELRDSQL